ncbi:MAG: YchF family ATPase [Phycisphaerae bacterium]|nr:YchF family ATPase [Phycisphaerae bacterium]
MRICFVGPPQSGKSTLFSAVVTASGSSVDVSRSDQSHMGVVKVPDERLGWLSEFFNPKKTTPAELEIIDLPGFDLSGEAGRSRSKAHWTAMRQSDCLVLVVRDFPDDSVAAYRSRIDALADVQELLIELLFADLEQVTARVEKLEVSVKKPTPKRDEQLRELELMKKLLDALENEKLLNEVIASDSDAKLVRSFGFLSQKPVLIVCNTSEDKLSSTPETIEDVPVLGLCAQIEEEIAQLDPSERGEFLADMNIDASASDRLVRACYDRMNLISFLTVGDDECRAWTIPANTPAVDAAGKIHSDIARGFIRAETVAYDDFHTAGDMKQAKANGTVRLEGKTYAVQDGDIINFRFNV